MTTDERIERTIAAVKAARTMAIDSLALGTLPERARELLQHAIGDLAQTADDVTTARYLTAQHVAQLRAAAQETP